MGTEIFKIEAEIIEKMEPEVGTPRNRALLSVLDPHIFYVNKTL